MKRGRWLVCVLLATMMLAAPAALGGQPKPGATYRSTTKAGDRITIRVSSDGDRYFLSTVDPCGTKKTGGELPIGPRGYFSAVDGNNRLKGHFASKRKVVGVITTPSCKKASGSRRFVAVPAG